MATLDVATFEYGPVAIVCSAGADDAVILSLLKRGGGVPARLVTIHVSQRGNSIRVFRGQKELTDGS